MDINTKYNVLKERLSKQGGLAVAFSGGVDSTFLLKAAQEALGENTLALTISSAFVPHEETGFAAEFCEKHGIAHLTVPVDVFTVESLAENTTERCYICKKALMSRLLEVARERGIASLAEGSNLDDDDDFRPGARAVRELGILSPLKDAQLTKAEIRELSRKMGLETADKPSLACLASRFPYGERITGKGLAAVDSAERYLRGLGLLQLRVRVHDALARIETDEQGFSRLSDVAVREAVYAYFREIGFSYTALDLLGYRTGSMNELL